MMREKKGLIGWKRKRACVRGGGALDTTAFKGASAVEEEAGLIVEMEGKEDRIGLFSRDVASGAGLREALETSERGATWNGPLEGGLARRPPIGP